MNIHASHNAAIFVEQLASTKLPVDCNATQSPGVITPKIKDQGVHHIIRDAPQGAAGRAI